MLISFLARESQQVGPLQADARRELRALLIISRPVAVGNGGGSMCSWSMRVTQCEGISRSRRPERWEPAAATLSWFGSSCSVRGID